MHRFKEAAARALCNLACDESNVKTIASSRAIYVLVGLLSDGSNPCKEAAAYALRNIACDESFVPDILSYGAVKHLVHMLSIDTEDGKVEDAAASALGGLACTKENKVMIGQSGAVEKLVYMVEQYHDKRCETAVWVLGSLCSESINKTAVVSRGGVHALTLQLRRGAPSVKEACAWAFRYLMHNCTDSDIAQSCSAAIPILVHMLSYGGCDRAKEAAAWAICSLACDISCCMAIVDAGALGPLMDILRSGDDTCKEVAAFALQNIGPVELRQAGFTIPMLKSAGVALSVLAAQRRLDGASAESMACDGFSFAELQEAGYDLIRMIVGGGPSDKIDSLKALMRLMSKDEEIPREYRMEVISTLAGLLRHENAEVTAMISKFLCVVSRYDRDGLDMAVNTGCLEALIALMGNVYVSVPCRSAVATAVGAMICTADFKVLADKAGALAATMDLLLTCRLSVHVDVIVLLQILLADSALHVRREVLGNADCVSLLVELLHKCQSSNSCSAEIPLGVANLIRLLAYDTESKGTWGEAGAIGHLVSMLRNPSDMNAEAAVSALRSLAWYHNTNIMRVFDAGALQHTKRLLCRGSNKCQTETLWLLNSLIGYGSSMVIDADCLGPMVQLLRNCHENTSEAAVCAIGNLVKCDKSCVESIISRGGIESIVGQFRNGSSTCKMAAACCLNSLYSVDRVSDILLPLGITKEVINSRMSG